MMCKLYKRRRRPRLSSPQRRFFLHSTHPEPKPKKKKGKGTLVVLLASSALLAPPPPTRQLLLQLVCFTLHSEEAEAEKKFSSSTQFYLRSPPEQICEDTQFPPHQPSAMVEVVPSWFNIFNKFCAELGKQETGIQYITFQEILLEKAFERIATAFLQQMLSFFANIYEDHHIFFLGKIHMRISGS